MTQAGGRAGRQKAARPPSRPVGDPGATAPGAPGRGILRSLLASRLTMPVAVVASLVIVLGAVLPFGSLLSVERSLGSREAELASLERTQSALSSEVHALQQPSVIDRLARERFGMVRKGQEALAIVPSGTGDGEQPAFARGFPGVPGAAATPAVPTTPLEATPPPLGAAVQARGPQRAAVSRAGAGGGLLARVVHDLESIL